MFGAQGLHSTDQQPLHMIDKETYVLGRIALLPAASTPIENGAKSAKVVTSMIPARPKLDAALQCMVFVSM